MTRERRIVAGVTALTALTRWFALSRSFWDWDEALLILGLRHYDVVAHHPHPPGFPLYVAIAKVFQFAGLGEFHALQAVNLIAAAAIVPVMYAFARQLDFDFATALSAAVLFAFFPNVWLFGGTAFSDVPAVVLCVGAATLLLRGGASLYWGAVASAVAIGFRPQNAIVLALPFVIAAWRDRRRGIIAIGMTAVIAGVAFGAAAYLSGGWTAYRAAVAEHERFIRSVDSFRSPGRPPMINVIADFLVRPFRAPLINSLLTILALAGVVVAVMRPRAGRWIAIASFAPVALLAVLYLNWLSASRFAIGYAPLVALLAADGIGIIPRRFQLAVSAIVVAIMMVWTLPAIRTVRSTDAPPVAAARYLGSRSSSRVYVDARLAAHADVLLPGARRTIVEMTALPAELPGDGVLFAEGVSGSPSARNFVRPVTSIVRPRYFAATVVPMRDVFTMRGSTVRLPPLPGDGQLTLRLRGSNGIVVRFNDHVIDQFHATGEVIRTYRLLSRSRVANELEVEGGRIETIGWLEAF